ncbi:hypothetical protein FVE85_4021 [Porphyridium purpureum]|uniref:Uncharacterized protein n=1 Tax=Porphyridium purpureum TaxID=35688 RepID=A0A5J4YRV8_PORPP|nr:hypothetical protein FVE85_4021 [Porphyridium purpureum]|eukprot:POR2768..scf229_5
MVFDLDSSTTFVEIVRKLMLLVIVLGTCVFAAYGFVAAIIQLFGVPPASARDQNDVPMPTSWIRRAQYRIAMVFVMPVIAAVWGAAAAATLNIFPVICIAGIYRNIPRSMSGTESIIVAVLLTVTTVISHHV